MCREKRLLLCLVVWVCSCHSEAIDSRDASAVSLSFAQRAQRTGLTFDQIQTNFIATNQTSHNFGRSCAISRNQHQTAMARLMVTAS